MTGSLAKPGRQRPGCDDIPDPRQADRNRRDDEAAKLTKPRSGSGVFDVRARRRIHLFSQLAFLIVIPRYD